MRNDDSIPRRRSHTSRGAVHAAPTPPRPPLRPLRGPFHPYDARPVRVCGQCLGDYWLSDARFEGVRLLHGLCAQCTERALAEGWAS